MLVALKRVQHRLARSFSRAREVQVACEALRESVEAGDHAWFERLVNQLRLVLRQQQNEAALAEVNATQTFPTAPQTSFPTVQVGSSPARPVAKSFPTASHAGAFPTAEVSSARTPSRSPEAPSEEEPPWLQALRLLEEAAKPRPAEAKGYFPAPAPQEEEEMQAYLDQFEPESEPSWARAIRILEAAPLKRAASPPLRPPPPEPAPEDRGRPVRMQSYQAMLHETAARTAPGASLPHFRPRPKAEVKPPRPEKKAEEDVGVGRGHLVPSLPSETEEPEEAELRKEDLVWSEHDFNDGDKENRRVLRGFTKEFKKMAEETPDGVRDPKLLTAALDLALACVKCYELDKADAIYRCSVCIERQALSKGPHTAYNRTEVGSWGSAGAVACRGM